ncbi:MAG: glycosyltransferase family 2 protein [Candidatus Nanopelagicales bacterium]
MSADTLEGFRPIGQILVQAGVITRQQLADALVEQGKSGGHLGRQLMLNGACTRKELYGALASQLGFPFVDLMADPPDAELMARLDPRQQVEREWIPYRWDGDTLQIATTEPPSRKAMNQAMQQFGAEQVDVVITTDWDLDQAMTLFCRRSLLFNAAEELATITPERSAKGKPVPWQRVAIWSLTAALIAGVILRPSATLIFILASVNVFFAAAILFKVVSTVVGLVGQHDDRVKEEQLRASGAWDVDSFDDADLPVYTILVPVFHEANVVDLVLEHLGELNWPKSKLQVLILAEEVDEETIAACKAARPPEFVRLLVVPKGSPQTKPRACNFGLMFSLGEYLVIYDAEDRPEPDQLRRSHAAFLADDADPRKARPLACVQAALNYFNWDANVLTRMFTLEYSSWFDGMLHGMVAWRMPIPLGGTSNHFRTDRLREMGGWDPYNVTEDADLGMRASAAGYRVGVIDSTTWEEACSRIPAFIRQRTRWIKGYMVTTLVDARYPVTFTRAAGWRSLVTLVGLIAGTPFAFLAYPVVWAITIVTYLGFETTTFSLPPALGVFATLNAVLGNILVLSLSAITGASRHGWRIAGYALLNPLYWCLHAIAAWRALVQLFFSPFHWEKTPHGLQTGREESSAVT